MRNKILIQIIISITLLCGCEDNISRVVRKMHGKEISFKWNNQYVLDDTIIFNYTPTSPIKVVSYIDTTLCSRCLETYFDVVKDYIKQINSDSVLFMCIFQHRSIEEIQPLLKDKEMSNISIVVDTDNLYLTTNSLDKYTSMFASFLLDKNNCVVLVGDPLRSSSVRELYDKKIKAMLENGAFAP